MSSINPNKTFYALADCNNFYASCERVFNPALIGKPIAVMSNNDGCIIARSHEAKKLGIPMGAPVFEYAAFMKAHNVHVCSSNFALYGDLSHRVMRTLEMLCPDLEIYSIDEAFMVFNSIQDLKQLQHIRQTVLKWTGIPISIGVGATKTLSKIANDYAKDHHPKEGIFILGDNTDKILKDMPVTDIWGIGRRLGAHLHRHGILTALDFKYANDTWVKKHLSIVGLRTVWEMRGISCIPFDEAPPPKKSITTSRSFGKAVTSLPDLLEAISTYTARAGEKVRAQNSLATYMDVFVTHKARGSDEYFTQFCHQKLPEPSSYTPLLIQYAKEALTSLYRTGLMYRKAGVILSELVDESCYQADLFTPVKNSEKKQKLMHLIDSINAEHGYQVVQFAAEGIEKEWKNKQVDRSPRYTTHWDELLTISI